MRGLSGPTSFPCLKIKINEFAAAPAEHVENDGQKPEYGQTRGQQKSVRPLDKSFQAIHAVPVMEKISKRTEHQRVGVRENVSGSKGLPENQ
jgi:hypothetical protein